MKIIHVDCEVTDRPLNQSLNNLRIQFEVLAVLSLESFISYYMIVVADSVDKATLVLL